MNHTSLLEICCVGVALLIASHTWFFMRVLRPIRQLSLQATQLSEGALDSLERPCEGIAEIRALHRAMAGMVGHVRRSQEQSRVYAQQLAAGQESERKRIAHELHDEAVQATIAVTQGLDMARSRVASDPEQALRMLQAVREQAVGVVTTLRNLIGGLRPPALEELGLIPALTMQLASLETVKASLTTQGGVRRLDEDQELTLFRIVQEAVRNTVRHSHAGQLQVTVDYESAGILLQIEDDGDGFQPPTQLGDLTFQQHYGLVGIQERVRSHHGWLRIDSGIGRGTRLKLYLPTSATAQPANHVQDPVCSAMIAPQQAYGSVVYQETTYYFCCPVCQGAFQKEPTLYVPSAETATH